MKPSRLWPEAMLFVLLIAVLGAQCVVQPIVGLANNGDFPKLLGRYALGPVEAESGNEFAYVVQHYRVDPQFHWESGHSSSELGLISLGLQIQRLFDRAIFDIRVMGAIHATLFLIAFALLCYRLRAESPIVRLLTGLAAIWIFADVAYVSYFNAFYMDSGAIIFLLILIGLLLNVSSRAGWVISTAAACLLITVKSQHTLLVFALIPYWLFCRWRGNRKLALTSAATLLLVGGLYSGLAPREWKATALFNVVFYHLLPRASDPTATLAELNLDQSYEKYRGVHAFVTNSPAQNAEWLRQFYDRCNHGTLVRYYLQHPSVAFASLREDLVTEAWGIRQGNLANYTRASGLPSGTLARSFDTWSNLRSALFVKWPYYPILWLLGFAAICRTPLAWLFVAMAGIELSVASLLDALETHRHLLIFHLLTDVTILMAVFGLVRWKWPRRESAVHSPAVEKVAF